jgi:sialidase-1
MKIYLYFIAAFFLLSCSKRTQVTSATGVSITSTAPVNPVIRGLSANPILKLAVYLPEGSAPVQLSTIHYALNANALTDLQSVEIIYNGQEAEFKKGLPSVTESVLSADMNTSVNMVLGPGYNYIWISGVLKNTASIDGLVELHVDRFTDDKGKTYKVQERGAGFAKRKAFAIRKAGEDNIHTYRIPGITTTNKGTLIAVYDNRYTTSRDLPGNVDVGMNRSTDGGQTWEAMKVIMDMGEPHDNNGVGDPAILFDPATNKIFVVALWSKGNRSIAGSGPGLTPDETGQFVISESSDDGLTWSKPVSITPQVKVPAWKLFFQGPGNGMVMRDGKLVFAAQYWDSSHMPYSTIIWSADHGKTWKSGIGAKSNTTEAQVIETTPGKLMLSMRDNRGKFRSISTTTDMGKTWTEHPTSYNTLPDPVCMAGFMKETVEWGGTKRDIVFFSNPATSSGRYNITVKASTDIAESWPEKYQVLIDERDCYGYSVMTKIDDRTIGLLYEGTRDLYFMRIPVKDISK